MTTEADGLPASLAQLRCFIEWTHRQISALIHLLVPPTFTSTYHISLAPSGSLYPCQAWEDFDALSFGSNYDSGSTQIHLINVEQIGVWTQISNYRVLLSQNSGQTISPPLMHHRATNRSKTFLLLHLPAMSRPLRYIRDCGINYSNREFWDRSQLLQQGEQIYPSNKVLRERKTKKKTELLVFLTCPAIHHNMAVQLRLALQR